MYILERHGYEDSGKMNLDCGRAAVLWWKLYLTAHFLPESSGEVTECKT